MVVETVALKLPVLKAPFAFGVISKAIELVERVRLMASLTVAVMLRFLEEVAAETELLRLKIPTRVSKIKVAKESLANLVYAPPPGSKMRT